MFFRNTIRDMLRMIIINQKAIFDLQDRLSDIEARAGARSVTGRSIGSPAERSEAGNHAETEGKPPFSGERSSPENSAIGGK